MRHLFASSGGLTSIASGNECTWRGEIDKVGYDHWNPLHAEAVAALKRERALADLTGVSEGAWVFPPPRDPSVPMTGASCCALWTQLAEAAKLPKGVGYGWHSFRRAFANRLRNAPVRDLKDIGGWRNGEDGRQRLPGAV